MYEQGSSELIIKTVSQWLTHIQVNAGLESEL